MDSNSEEQKNPEIIFDQYECINCKKKSYINTEDKDNEEMICPYCKEQTKNIRALLMEIKQIREY